jgi:4-diphosphocytidyl-2C-methyl-D-erythritol kinase
MRCFMSGSGATCVALCRDEAVTPDLDPGWWSVRTRLG